MPKRVLWSIIDHRSAIKYADSDELKGEAIELLKNGAVASPFSCTNEESITRRIYDLIHKRRLTKRIKLEREMMT